MGTTGHAIVLGLQKGGVCLRTGQPASRVFPEMYKITPWGLQFGIISEQQQRNPPK